MNFSEDLERAIDIAIVDERLSLIRALVPISVSKPGMLRRDIEYSVNVSTKPGVH